MIRYSSIGWGLFSLVSDTKIYGIRQRGKYEMDADNPRSRGKIVEDGWETASLVNPTGAQFKLGKNTVWVWKACNGNTTRLKLTAEFGKTFEKGEEESAKTVETILATLEKIGLISLPGKILTQ